MTLEEFAKAFMEANSIQGNVEDMCKHIAAEARKVQQGGYAVLDEEQVERIILGAKLETRKEGMVLTSKGPKVVLLEEKPKSVPKQKKEDGQLDIFSLGVGLFD